MKLLVYCRHNRESILPLLQGKEASIQPFELQARLHIMVDELRATLQSIIDKESSHYESILLFLGACATHKVDFSKAHCPVYALNDANCLRALTNEAPQDAASTFLVSASWMQSENNLQEQLTELKEHYGEKKGAQIFRLYFKNYTTFLYLYENKGESQYASYQDIANDLGIRCIEAPMDKGALYALLEGKPHKKIKKMNV